MQKTGTDNEQRERLSSIKDGPWICEGRFALDQLNPKTDLAPVSSSSQVCKLEDLILVERDRLLDEKLRISLRDHRISPITLNSELKLRDSLDWALTYFQLLELALASGYIELSDEHRTEIRSSLLSVLWSKSVREFVSTYGYFSVLSLCERVGIKIEGQFIPIQKSKDEIGFATFLCAYREWISDKSIEEWLGFLDDYRFRGFGTKALLSFLNSGELPTGGNKIIEEHANKIAFGAYHSVTLLANLFSSINDDDAKFAYGLFFLYWLGKLFGQNVPGVVESAHDWSQDLAQKFGTSEIDEDGFETNLFLIDLQRVRDTFKYTVKRLEIVRTKYNQSC